MGGEQVQEYQPGPLPRRLFTIGGALIQEPLSYVDATVLARYFEYLDFEAWVQQQQEWAAQTARSLQAGLISENDVL